MKRDEKYIEIRVIISGPSRAAAFFPYFKARFLCFTYALKSFASSLSLSRHSLNASISPFANATVHRDSNSLNAFSKASISSLAEVHSAFDFSIMLDLFCSRVMIKLLSWLRMVRLTSLYYNSKRAIFKFCYIKKEGVN